MQGTWFQRHGVSGFESMRYIVSRVSGTIGSFHYPQDHKHNIRWLRFLGREQTFCCLSGFPQKIFPGHTASELRRQSQVSTSLYLHVLLIIWALRLLRKCGKWVHAMYYKKLFYKSPFVCQLDNIDDSLGSWQLMSAAVSRLHSSVSDWSVICPALTDEACQLCTALSPHYPWFMCDLCAGGHSRKSSYPRILLLIAVFRASLIRPLNPY